MEVKVSGGEGTRTLDLRLAKPSLFQLSYTPKRKRRAWHATLDVWAMGLAILGRLRRGALTRDAGDRSSKRPLELILI